MGRKFLLVAPLRVPLSKNKDFILNQNVYRNTHYQSLDKAKKNYSDHMFEQVQALPQMEAVKVTYRVFPSTKRKYDLMNVVAIHSKFFLDTMTKAGVIPDDTHDIVVQETMMHGEVDKLNPRVEIEVEELMIKIIQSLEVVVDEEGLRAAIIRELVRQNPRIVVKDMSFKAKRGANAGIETTVEAFIGTDAEVQAQDDMLAELDAKSGSAEAEESPSAKSKAGGNKPKAESPSAGEQQSLPLSEEELDSEASSCATQSEDEADAEESDEAAQEETQETNSSEATESFEDQENRLIDEALAEDDEVPFEGDSVQESVEADAEKAEATETKPRKSLFGQKHK